MIKGMCGCEYEETLNERAWIYKEVSEVHRCLIGSEIKQMENVKKQNKDVLFLCVKKE